MADDEYEPIFLDGELRFVEDEPQLCDVPTPCCDVDICLPRPGNTGPVYVDRVVLFYQNASILLGNTESGLATFEIHFRALAVNDAPNAVYIYRWEKQLPILDSDRGDIPESGVVRSAFGFEQINNFGRPQLQKSRRLLIPTPNVSSFEFVRISGSGYRGPEDDALLAAEGLNPNQLSITVASAVSINLGRTVQEYKWRNLNPNYYTYSKSAAFASTNGGVEEGARWYPGGETFCPNFHEKAPAPFPFTDEVVGYTAINGGREPGVGSGVFNGASPLMMMGFVSGNGPLANDYLLSNTGYASGPLVAGSAGFRMDCTLEGMVAGIPPSASINISGITRSAGVYNPTAKPQADVNGPERELIDDGLLEALAIFHNGSFTGSPDWNRGMAGSWLGVRDDIGCGFQFLVRTNRLKNPSLTYDNYISGGGSPEDWYKEWLWQATISVSVNEIVGLSNFAAGFTSNTLDGTVFPSAATLEVGSAGGFFTRDPAWIAQAINYFSGWVRNAGSGTSPVQLQHYQIEVDSTHTQRPVNHRPPPNANQCDFSVGAPRIDVDLHYWGDKTATLIGQGITARP